MAQKSPLVQAEKLLRARKYSQCISLLEPLILEYRETFRFYFLLGSAYMYVGDLGGAELYFSKARRFTATNTDLILAQAAVYLQKGEIRTAVSYYLDVKDADPKNKTAKKALQFIHQYCRDNDPKRNGIPAAAVKKLYPSFGIHPAVLPSCICILVLLGAGFFFYRNSAQVLGLNGARADLSALELTIDEKRTAIETDLSGGVYRYLLSQSQVTASYEKARKYFQLNKDNAAQVEINRILNSNASSGVKYKAHRLKEYLEVPSFDTLTVSYSYTDVAEDPFLYKDCWVVWQGFIANAKSGDDYFNCDLFVGDEDFKHMEGFVPVIIPQPVFVETGRSVHILAQIDIQDGRVVLKGKSVYQPVLK